MILLVFGFFEESPWSSILTCGPSSILALSLRTRLEVPSSVSSTLSTFLFSLFYSIVVTFFLRRGEGELSTVLLCLNIDSLSVLCKSAIFFSGEPGCPSFYKSETILWSLSSLSKRSAQPLLVGLSLSTSRLTRRLCSALELVAFLSYQFW